MEIIKEALTFDDVTLAPNYSQVLPSEVNTSTDLSKNLSLKIPLLTSDGSTCEKLGAKVTSSNVSASLMISMSLYKRFFEN